MKNKKTLQKIITKLVENSFKDGYLVESRVISAIKMLKLQPKVEAILALSEYLKQLKRIQRKHTMFIETVIPLSDIQIKKVKKIVEKRYKITKIVSKISPEILGGFKLKIGDEIWDESIVGKALQVKEVITHGRSN